MMVKKRLLLCVIALFVFFGAGQLFADHPVTFEKFKDKYPDANLENLPISPQPKEPNRKFLDKVKYEDIIPLSKGITGHVQLIHQNPAFIAFIRAFWLFCFVVGVVIRYYQFVEANANGDRKPLPIIGMIMHFFMVGVLIHPNIQAIPKVFDFMTFLIERLAEIIFPNENYREIFKLIFTETVDEKVSFLDLSLGRLMTPFFLFFAKIAFLVLKFVRVVLLTTLLAFYPIVCCLALIPSYGMQLLKEYVKVIIQINFWSVTMAVICTTMVALFGGAVTNAVDLAIMGAIFIVVIIFGVPKISQVIFGGGDLAALTGFIGIAAMKGANAATRLKSPIPPSTTPSKNKGDFNDMHM